MKSNMPPMVSRIPAAVMLGITALLIVSIVLYIDGLSGRFTGMSFISQGPSNLSFVSPTPSNASIMNTPWIIINVSSSENISLAVLSWGSQNITMSHNNQFAWTMVNGTGIYPIIVYILDQHGGSSNTEERMIQVGYVNWTLLSEQLIMEDTTYNLDPWSLFSTNNNKTEIGIAIAQNRADIVSCGLTFNRYLNCTTLQDAFGTTTLTLKATDGPVFESLQFNLTVLATNDPPRLIRPLDGTTISHTGSLELNGTTYFSDPESDNVTFHIQNPFPVPWIYTNQTGMLILPNATSVGEFNMTLIANDSKNITTSNTALLKVNVNLPPQIVTKLKNLVLNGSKAYRLKFYQVFKDPEGDPLTFTYTNLSIVRLLREGNSVYILTQSNISGTENLNMSASDGQSTTSYLLPITVIIDTTSNRTSSQELENTEQNITPLSSGASDLFIQNTSSPKSTIALNLQQGGKVGINLSHYLNLSRFNLDTIQVLPKGLTNLIIDQIDGFMIFLTAKDSTWTGSEQLHFYLSDDIHNATSGEFNVTVLGEPKPQTTIPFSQNTYNPQSKGPLLIKQFPSITLSANETETILDLSEYFSDPGGKGLEYLIEKKSGLRTEIHSQKLAVISLSSPSNPISNESIRVLAKDDLGNIATGDVIVSTIDQIYKYQVNIDLFLQIIMAISFLIIVGLIYVRHTKTPHTTPSLPHFSLLNQPLKDTLFSLEHPIPHANQKDHPLAGNRQSLIGILIDSFEHLVTRVSPQQSLHEPSEYRREALLIKEGILAIKAISSSSDDRLIRSALAKEQEKLRKGLELLRGKADLTHQELKRLCLYIKEVASSTEQILDLTEEYLIYTELRRVSIRLKRLAKDLEIRLSYFGNIPQFGR